MIDPQAPQPIPTPPRSRYGVALLDTPETREGGVVHGAGARDLLPWSRVLRALAAEVGEPEGVRTIVFDLVTAIADGRCQVSRFDAEPGTEALGVAKAIEGALGAERCDASLRAVATDGHPERWFPDLEAFEEAALESINPPLAPGEPIPDPDRKPEGPRDERDKEWAEP